MKDSGDFIFRISFLLSSDPALISGRRAVLFAGDVRERSCAASKQLAGQIRQSREVTADWLFRFQRGGRRNSES
ncbi:MAG TPA: hypothetical protein VNQ79_03750 [Blastocatellia bacterium]|nr:hypothetical protein [Blastocatellia bacterium]